MRRTTFILLATALTLGACSSGPAVRVDHDPSVQVTQYRTFGFYEPASPDAARYSTLTSQRLRLTTRAQLEALGYRYDERAPDLRVNFIIAVQDRQEVRSARTTPRGVPVYRVWGGTVDLDTVNYKVGTLAIDMVDAKRNALVWRGVAEGRLGEKDLRDPGAAVGRAVKEIFTRLTPIVRS